MFIDFPRIYKNMIIQSSHASKDEVIILINYRYYETCRTHERNYNCLQDFGRKSDRKRRLEIPKRTLEDDNKIDLK
jgi:hypothetical protein